MRRRQRKRILLRLANGVTTIQELKELIKITKDEYKADGKKIKDYIKLQAYEGLLGRLSTSVLGKIGKFYLDDIRKYAIHAEYHNTKLFIDSTAEILEIAKRQADILDHKTYGQPNSGYIITEKLIVHLVLRHNESVNSFLNKDSVKGGYNPSSFTSGGLFGASMLPLLMALNQLHNSDWKKAKKGKNLICHFRAGGVRYTIVRKGTSKEILSFYERNRDDVKYIEMTRKPDKMEFVRK